MLATLDTIRARLGLLDLVDDVLLTQYGAWVHGRFNLICNRVFERTADSRWEFDGDVTELRPINFPVESVAGFDLKTDETTGWIAQANVSYLVRNKTVIRIHSPIGTSAQIARVTYTGGYVLPGTTPASGQLALPDEIQQAATEQVAYLYQNRNRLGLTSISGEGGSIQQFAQLDLLPAVKATLKKYERFDP